jgi:hypothetical protein
MARNRGGPCTYEGKVSLVDERRKKNRCCRVERSLILWSEKKSKKYEKLLPTAEENYAPTLKYGIRPFPSTRCQSDGIR